jgi:hypothetical protein
MEKKSYGFDVFLNGKNIDTVFYSSDYFKGFKNLNEVKESIKKSLVEHDGYNPNITVK